MIRPGWDRVPVTHTISMRLHMEDTVEKAGRILEYRILYKPEDCLCFTAKTHL